MKKDDIMLKVSVERIFACDVEIPELGRMSSEILLSLLIDLDDEELVRKFRKWIVWIPVLHRRDFKYEWLDKYADIVVWGPTLEYLMINPVLQRRISLKKVFSVVAKNFGRIGKDHVAKICKLVPLPPSVVTKYIDRVTEDIFDNPLFRTYPNSLRLLLKQKFNRQEV